MSNDEYFIEPKQGGGFKVLKPGASRARAVTRTQGEAIAEAKRLNPNATIHVARVRDIGPGPDKFRKVKG